MDANTPTGNPQAQEKREGEIIIAVTEPEHHSPNGERSDSKENESSDSEKNETNGPGGSGVTATVDHTTKDDYPTGLRLVSIVIALVLCIFLFALDMTIVATAIPKITDEFHRLEDISWYGSAFYMTASGSISQWGKIYKYFPIKTAYLCAIIIFEVGSLICAVAQNSNTLIVGRAIAGIGAGGLGSGSYTVIGFSAPPSRQPILTSIVGGSYGVAAILGPILGGLFSDKVTWRWCFYINLPVGGLSALILLFFFRTPKAAKPTPATMKEKFLQMDLIGSALMMGSLISFILAFQYGGLTRPWDDSVVIGLIVGFAVISILFVIWQFVYSHNDRSMIPPRLLRDRQIWSVCLFSFFNAGTYFGSIYLIPIYFQSVDGVSPMQSGIRNIPMIVALLLGMTTSALTASTAGIATPWIPLGAVITTAATGLLYTLDTDSSMGKWIGYQVFAGFGWGFSFQIPITVAQATATADDLAMITATILLLNTISGGFFVAGGQSAFLSTMVEKLKTTAPAVNPLIVIATGASEIRKVFPPELVPGIVDAYMAGLKIGWAVLIGGMGIATLASLTCTWKRLDVKPMY